ncbi:hypothetical protein HMPREF0766_13260 [Sphingobacterium spiritivorum ATCC 33861]|uniref:Uncharacterized protein n=1 Tax=Sphingobacterium spiritivorum ATCC 33861 TaxID=525373 RepID=D7VQK6_SPHSI|nr:hypothetical protein HMPREF0766_13260 [Sphingobacterium spiritivorum ATCC 33861]
MSNFRFTGIYPQVKDKASIVESNVNINLRKSNNIVYNFKLYLFTILNMMLQLL